MENLRGRLKLLCASFCSVQHSHSRNFATNYCRQGNVTLHIHACPEIDVTAGDKQVRKKRALVSFLFFLHYLLSEAEILSHEHAGKNWRTWAENVFQRTAQCLSIHLSFPLRIVHDKAAWARISSVLLRLFTFVSAQRHRSTFCRTRLWPSPKMMLRIAG